MRFLNRLLEYPFTPELILKKRKSIKKYLIELDKQYVTKNIAVLGGSTTHDIVSCMELFLLNQGIKAKFYESEYARYYEDAIFPNLELEVFNPDIIFIHTTNRNITNFPSLADSADVIDEQLEEEYKKFEGMWDSLREKYHCPIIQNNFEYPLYRILGNKDASDIHGKTNYITRLNLKFYEYAQSNMDFYINDINYLSADFGLEKWSDPFFWHMYKYALCMQAIPSLSFSVSNIIKSLFGKNKKALALDLDNTLWGGIIGDDGVDNIAIGPETSSGQVYSEFQHYIKENAEIGIILNIVSKNEYENAISGLEHEYSEIKPSDCISIKANWDPKSHNLEEIISEVDLTQESFVFVDDNPAEREIIRQNLTYVTVPEMTQPEHYICTIDRAGYFEVTNLSSDDLGRTAMYKDNMKRKAIQNSFINYEDYLKSLEMIAIIKPFEEEYFSRIAQLTNKSNQFNLTTKRFTREEIVAESVDETRITLYGKLVDKFGDNGVVSVVIGDIDGDTLHLSLWLMSCRVLKRDMEFAMMDTVVAQCVEKGIKSIKGYYYKTAKNGMVANFYELQGFTKVSELENGDSIWEYSIPEEYTNKNKVIIVNGK